MYTLAIFLLTLVFASSVFYGAERTVDWAKRRLQARRNRKALENRNPNLVRLEEENKLLKVQLGLPPERRLMLEPEPEQNIQSSGRADCKIHFENNASLSFPAAAMLAGSGALLLLAAKKKRSEERKKMTEAYNKLATHAEKQRAKCQDPSSDDSN